MSEKRFQVFISSTFTDLQEERKAVTQAILQINHMPAGMELFPASNEEQWELIKRVINESDYYVVIVAGRYGSIGKDGISYTEMEYNYAQKIGKPTIGFVHKDPGKIPAEHTEPHDDGKQKLETFRKSVQGKMCKHWSNGDDLHAAVIVSLLHLIRTSPAVGWMRANEVASDEATNEILKLRKKVEQLESALTKAQTTAPQGIEQLQQGEDLFDIHFTYSRRINGTIWPGRHTSEVSLTWNTIFNCLGPHMLNDQDEPSLYAALNRQVEKEFGHQVSGKSDLTCASAQVDADEFQVIKMQLRALGLIVKSEKPKSIADSKTYWVLTPYGDQLLSQNLAIHKPPPSSRIPEKTAIPAN